MRVLKQFLALLALMFAASITSQAMAACPPTHAVLLDQAVTKTIDAVRNQRADQFLSLVGPQGLSFGTDGATLDKPALVREFNARTGHYCDLFRCARGLGPIGQGFASPRIEKNISVTRTINAMVVIGRGSPLELELSYHFESDCKWYLVAIGTL